ncbi:alpha tubulin suppressor [Oleoguttula sp. CCFEE 5521]
MSYESIVHLLAIGSNGSGQLAQFDLLDVKTPTEIAFGGTDSVKSLPDSEIVDIAAGGNHTIVLCGDGRAFTSGQNDDGRLGHGGEVQGVMKVVGLPPVLKGQHELNDITHVAATWSASFFISHGTVYSCGSGDRGELGQGPQVTRSSKPAAIPAFPPEGTQITKLLGSMAHVVAVLSDGSVYGWGNGRKGQLGEPSAEVWEPRRIDHVPFPVGSAACSKDFTCFIGASGAGEIRILGPRSHDRFGVRSAAPSAVPGWKTLAASWGSIYVLTSNGNIVAWGRNDHGQLPPAGLPSVQQLAAGSEHCIAVAATGRVLAWGWGEHGNCGEPVDERGDVKGRWNVLSATDMVIAVYAGCATSFFVTIDRPG